MSRRLWRQGRRGPLYWWIDLEAINVPRIRIQLRERPRFVSISWGNGNSDPVWSLSLEETYQWPADVPTSAELLTEHEQPYVDKVRKSYASAGVVLGTALRHAFERARQIEEAEQ